MTQVMSCLSTLGCASSPISWGTRSPRHSFPTPTHPQETTTVLAQGWIFCPAAEIPLPVWPGLAQDTVPTLTGSVICPQKCCPNLSFIPGKSQHTDLTPGLFHLACDPAPPTYSSLSMLACLQCFPWPSCNFHLLLVPDEPDLLWGQLCWMGTSGASNSRAEA